MQRVLFADGAGRGVPKTSADFRRCRGNDVVEALMDGVSVAEADEDFGALGGRECVGETKLALQIGPFDETKYFGIVDMPVIVLFQRTARQNGSYAEGNAHLGLQRVVKWTLGVAAGVTGRSFRDTDRNRRDVLRRPEFAHHAQRRLRRGLCEI